jgi:hypothetical protein
MMYMCRVIMGISYGISFGHPDQLWRNLRKVWHQKIRMHGTDYKRNESITQAMISDLVTEFQKQRGKSFDTRMTNNTFMNVTMLLLLGKTYSTDDELFRKMAGAAEADVHAGVCGIRTRC